jgi:hypothetical protein
LFIFFKYFDIVIYKPIVPIHKVVTQKHYVNILQFANNKQQVVNQTSMVGVPAFHFGLLIQVHEPFLHLLILQKTDNSFPVNRRQQQR